MKPRRLSPRGFLEVAAIGGGALIIAGITRQVHNHIDRNFHPERARVYMDSIHPDPGKLPKIAIILCDDLGWGVLYSPAVDLLNLRRMANEGISLTGFYASASVCSPSPAWLLTGRYAARTLFHPVALHAQPLERCHGCPGSLFLQRTLYP